MTGPAPRLHPGALLVVVAGLLTGSMWWLVDVEVAAPLLLTVADLLLFMSAAAVMELLPIRLPDGRAVPTSLAVTGAAAILGASPIVLALIAMGGWLLARLLDRSALRPGLALLRGLGGWGLGGVAAVGFLMGPATWTGTAAVGAAAAVNMGAALAVSGAIVVGVPAVDALVRAETPWRYLPKRVIEAVRANVLVGVAVASTAALGALVDPVLGRWTLPTMLMPLFAARIGLDRYAVAARAYDQTLRAMSRLPEQLATVSGGHGERVGRLAEAVALELGLDGATVSDVVRAAHLHELGRIQLEHDGPVTQRELAVAGAGVIRESPRLSRVANIVEAHGQLHDRQPGRLDPTTERAASIVAACCDVDRYAPTPGVAAQRHELVVRLVRDVGDLEVVAALTRVLDREDPAPRSNHPVDQAGSSV